MPKQGLNPNFVTYNTLISGFYKVGNCKEAIKLFKQMKDSGCVPDSITYTLMDGLCKECTPQEANSILQDFFEKV
jgi:pentatricopeptide repeat protein